MPTIILLESLLHLAFALSWFQNAEVSNLHDLGKLLLACFVLAVALALTITCVRLRLRARKSSSSDFISLSSIPKKE